MGKSSSRSKRLRLRGAKRAADGTIKPQGNPNEQSDTLSSNEQMAPEQHADGFLSTQEIIYPSIEKDISEGYISDQKAEGEDLDEDAAPGRKEVNSSNMPRENKDEWYQDDDDDDYSSYNSLDRLTTGSDCDIGSYDPSLGPLITESDIDEYGELNDSNFGDCESNGGIDDDDEEEEEDDEEEPGNSDLDSNSDQNEYRDAFRVYSKTPTSPSDDRQDESCSEYSVEEELEGSDHVDTGSPVYQIDSLEPLRALLPWLPAAATKQEVIQAAIDSGFNLDFGSEALIDALKRDSDEGTVFYKTETPNCPPWVPDPDSPVDYVSPSEVEDSHNDTRNQPPPAPALPIVTEDSARWFEDPTLSSIVNNSSPRRNRRIMPYNAFSQMMGTPPASALPNGHIWVDPMGYNDEDSDDTDVILGGFIRHMFPQSSRIYFPDENKENSPPDEDDRNDDESSEGADEFASSTTNPNPSVSASSRPVISRYNPDLSQGSEPYSFGDLRPIRSFHSLERRTAMMNISSSAPRTAAHRWFGEVATDIQSLPEPTLPVAGTVRHLDMPR
ncbi:hypothetical protein FQN57_001881 [Myotisia sp. PD_48]|nr:hypothetical protein FQN57_001881 [Myotisia sp. PD_48]